MKIQLASKKNLSQCAKILMDIYNSNVLNEGWTTESSNAICEYYFKRQPDLFYIAKENNVVAGFTFSYIKPWADGNQLMIEEISVKEEFRKQGIAKNLLTTLLDAAKAKYNITCANGTTYIGECEMPFAWYERIGFKKVDNLFLIEGETNEVLKKLKLNNKRN